MAEDNKQIYPVPPALFEGIMGYLRTRPLGEALEGYMALSQIQPVEMIVKEDEAPTPAKRGGRRAATETGPTEAKTPE